uniref:Chemokine interleukin-8-like domain-containing protein n=1 Tax=Scleropages formosus TaxID=113540 RepID=A0A8D0CHH7_SCLFO
MKLFDISVKLRKSCTLRRTHFARFFLAEPFRAQSPHELTCSAAGLRSSTSATRSRVYCRPPSMRCRCISAVSACRRDDIEKLETLSAGPHCPRDQVIVTLKHGRKRCLEPKSPEVKLCIQRFMAR